MIHAARIGRAFSPDSPLSSPVELETLARVVREAEVGVVAAVRSLIPGDDDIPDRERELESFKAALQLLAPAPLSRARQASLFEVFSDA